MRSFGGLVAFTTMVMTILSLTYSPAVFATTTTLQIYSPNQSATVVVKLPHTSTFGCGPTIVAHLTAVGTAGTIYKIKQVKGFPNIGYFTLPQGHTVALAPTAPFSCLQGALITFVTLPQCPCNTGTPKSPFNSQCSTPRYPFGFDPSNPSFPNGVNLAEATVNVPSADQETVDISCNQGANSTINVTFNPMGSTQWNNGAGGNTNVTSIQNSWVDISSGTDNNCNLTGVFPYGLSKCTVGPASCVASGFTYCSETAAGCAIQRSGSGGTVLITYMGPLSPP